MAMVTIASEPRQTSYLLLLQVALECCDTFSLVWGDRMRLGQLAKVLETELLPFLEKELRSNTWPGTQLLSHSATVRFYRYIINTKAILEKVSGLYDWQAPNYPEDLAFYRVDGSCWLGSIAHESDSFLEIDYAELAFLRNRMPELKLIPA